MAASSELVTLMVEIPILLRHSGISFAIVKKFIYLKSTTVSEIMFWNRKSYRINHRGRFSFPVFTKMIFTKNCPVSNQGEYEASVDHCASAYELGSQLGEMVEHPAVLLGIATACTLSPLYHLNIEDPSRNMLERLVLWKDERLNELDTLSGGNGLFVDLINSWVTVWTHRNN